MYNINSKYKTKVTFKAEKYSNSEYIFKNNNGIKFKESEGVKTTTYGGLHIHSYGFEYRRHDVPTTLHYRRREEDDNSTTSSYVRSDKETINKLFNYILSYYKNHNASSYVGDIDVESSKSENDDIKFTRKVEYGDKKKDEFFNIL